MKYELFKKDTLGYITRIEVSGQTVACLWHALFRMSECLLYYFVTKKNWS